ncbi:MAG: excinuclease ABC subunit UvrC [Bacteroidota bacterium]|nr:excinuclease ABC subunit UvrC [Bacteroidota bacterium]
MKLSKIALQLKTLPKESGVYKFFDKGDKILYVGKARNIRKRVNSYFSMNHKNFKTNLLVKQIFKIENIVVESEMDALLLENNLIKKLKPKYNVLLKDGKTYPWICIKKYPSPQIFLTRKIEKKSGEYFGPYSSSKSVRFLIQMIKDLYPFLNHELSHLLKIKNEENEIILFDKNIKSIKSIIKGNFKNSVQQFKEEMLKLSSKREYEKAQEIKEKLDIISTYQAKSTIVNPKITNTDVFSIFSDENYSYVNFMQISHGAIIGSYSIEIKKKLNESDKRILEISIIELRKRFNSISREILVPFEITFFSEFKCLVPKLGDKKKLIHLSLKNAKSYRMERLRQIKIIDPERHFKRIISKMKKDLRLSKEPIHIECFDNSNIQGTSPTASCVVFKNLKPKKNEYRHFKINSVSSPDDFKSMEEVVYRRYKDLAKKSKSLPQLIIIDGGKGQLSSSIKSLNILGLNKKIAIIAIAKRLEEIFFPKDPIPLYLDKKSETLKIIQQIRNEAHRFAINLHRKIRNKNSLASPLDNIVGIGPKTKEKLLKKFKSLKRIKETSEKDLVNLLGNKTGKIIFNKIHFMKKE